MGLPYRGRLDERRFLDLPGVSDEEAYVFAYVEDTRERGLRWDPLCDEGCSCCPENFEPRIVLEIGEPGNVFRLPLWVEGTFRDQSLHAIDTLTAALGAMRAAVVAEAEEYDRRERLLEDLRSVG
jgi:hypothetical protein